MNKCPYCGFPNRDGVFFCDDCAQPVYEDPKRTTLPTRAIEAPPDEDVISKSSWGTARLNENATIMMHVRDAHEPIHLIPARRLVIGRADASTNARPDIDLTPYGALEKGVSRIHAAIERSDDTLMLIDMRSANGTHLNGQRLTPEQPRVLRDGDEIRFGKLVAHIYFKTSSLF